MKYRLYDVYDEKYKIGEYSNMNSVKAACRKWDLETDGENFLILYRLEKDGKFHKFENWGY